MTDCFECRCSQENDEICLCSCHGIEEESLAPDEEIVGDEEVFTEEVIK